MQQIQQQQPLLQLLQPPQQTSGGQQSLHSALCNPGRLQLDLQQQQGGNSGSVGDGNDPGGGGGGGSTSSDSTVFASQQQQQQQQQQANNGPLVLGRSVLGVNTSAPHPNHSSSSSSSMGLGGGLLKNCVGGGHPLPLNFRDIGLLKPRSTGHTYPGGNGSGFEGGQIEGLLRPNSTGHHQLQAAPQLSFDGKLPGAHGIPGYK